MSDIKKQQEEDIKTEEKQEEEGNKIFDIKNLNPTIHISKSVYEKLFELVQKSPAAAITSICVLFIVVILSIVIPTMFSPCKSS